MTIYKALKEIRKYIAEKRHKGYHVTVNSNNLEILRTVWHDNLRQEVIRTIVSDKGITHRLERRTFEATAWGRVERYQDIKEIDATHVPLITSDIIRKYKELTQ